MGLFGKKPSRDDIIKQGIADAEAEAAASELNDKDDEINTGNPKVDMELTKINAQLQGFTEIRQSNSERFSRMSEQMGELRGMIVDTNKAISKVEVAATKAVDLVNSVHPEKLMIEVRKQDGKIEALRANIESNEAIMQDIMSELKKMREQVKFYQGVEQVAKMNDEVKQELANIKKVEGNIERHADRVETIFIEVEKKFAEFDKFNDIAKSTEAEMKRISGEFDKVKLKMETKEDKKEFVNLMNKFNEFEKHTSNLLKLLDNRSQNIKEELTNDFDKLKKALENKLKVSKVDLEKDSKPLPKPEKEKPKKKNLFKRILTKSLDETPEEKPEGKESEENNEVGEEKDDSSNSSDSVSSKSNVEKEQQESKEETPNQVEKTVEDFEKPVDN